MILLNIVYVAETSLYEGLKVDNIATMSTTRNASCQLDYHTDCARSRAATHRLQVSDLHLRAITMPDSRSTGDCLRAISPLAIESISIASSHNGSTLDQGTQGKAGNRWKEDLGQDKEGRALGSA